MVRPKVCAHLSGLSDLKTARAPFCEECLKIGSRWVHLRTCQTCSITLCCDSSSQRHATAHYLSTAHPVVASAEPGERWFWCFEDEELLRY